MNPGENGEQEIQEIKEAFRVEIERIKLEVKCDDLNFPDRLKTYEAGFLYGLDNPYGREGVGFFDMIYMKGAARARVLLHPTDRSLITLNKSAETTVVGESRKDVYLIECQLRDFFNTYTSTEE